MTTNARLRAFIEVAETGSIRSAAERLYITESAVSSAITILNKDIGVALIERDGRGIRLTKAGASYAHYARTILGLHEQAVSAARDQGSPGDGLIRIAAVTTAAEHQLPALLAALRHDHPNIRLRLMVCPRDQLWRAFTHHEVDIVVAGRKPDGVRAVSRAVKPNTLVVVGDPSQTDEFSPERATWLLREHGSGTRATCLALLEGMDIDHAHLTLGSHGAVVAGAVSGLGVTLVSREAVTELLHTGRLVELPVSGTPINRPWHVVTHAETTGSTELLIHQLFADPGTAWTKPG